MEYVQVENVTDECIIWLQDWFGKDGDVKVGFSIFMKPQNVDVKTKTLTLSKISV